MHIFRQKNTNNLIILRETKEKKLYKESTFYRHLANQLNTMFLNDLIPKEMWKDGNLVSDGQFYLTDRKRRFAFYQDDWACFDINKDYYNKTYPLVLNFFKQDTTKPEDYKFLQELPTYETEDHPDGIEIIIKHNKNIAKAKNKKYTEVIQEIINQLENYKKYTEAIQEITNQLEE